MTKTIYEEIFYDDIVSKFNVTITTYALKL
jgi:hypothetical protein